MLGVDGFPCNLALLPTWTRNRVVCLHDAGQQGVHDEVSTRALTDSKTLASIRLDEHASDVAAACEIGGSSYGPIHLIMFPHMIG